MGDINNRYKRFQTYKNDAKQNTFRQDYMEQNYKVEKALLGEKCELDDKRELGEKRELPKVESSFIKKSTRLGVNNKGQFFKK